MRRQRPMRVLLVIGSARHGGAEGQLTRLACELRRSGVDVRVLLTVGGPLTESLDRDGVWWEVLSDRFRWLPSSTARGVGIVSLQAWRLASWQPHVVYAWLPAAVRITLPLARFLTRAKRVAAFRGGTFLADHGAGARTFRSAVAHAHAVTVNAPSLVDEALHWGARREQIVFIPNGVDIPAQPSDVRVSPPTAVVIANFRWYKGHEVLVDALAMVDQPVQVRLAGEGTEREKIRQRAVAREVASRVCFVEHPAVVAAELARAQFAIHPSRTEGMANAVLEELASGLPVVATDVGATGLLVADGVNGFLVPPGDEYLLAKRISELAASPDLRASMAVEARKRAQDFGWDVCLRRYVALLDNLGRRGRRE